MQDQSPCFIVEHDNDQTSIVNEQISDAITYYNIYSVEGLYANHLDQLEGIAKPPCIIRERLHEIRKYLQKNHSNFVSCELSSVRCSGFTHSCEGSIKEEPTVAIYCRVKGFVPLYEEKFPSQFDGYKTDIRPGFIFLCKEISSGMPIYHNKDVGYGSLGPIYEHPFSKKAYALSAGHNFFTSSFFAHQLQASNQQLDNFLIDIDFSVERTYASLKSEVINIQEHTDAMDIDEDDDSKIEAQIRNKELIEIRSDNIVYDVQSGRKIGNIERVMLRSGKNVAKNEDGQSGIDICTIRLDEDIDKKRNFPETVSKELKERYGRWFVLIYRAIHTYR